MTEIVTRRTIGTLCVAATLACLSLVAPAPGPAAQMPSSDPHAWKPVPARGGAVPWTVFAEAKITIVNKKGNPVFVATLTDQLRKMNGRTIRINGFMMPLDPSNDQKHFLMLAYPLSCPFHLSIGGSQIIEVKVLRPIKFTYEPVLLEGTLQLTDPAASGLIYLLKNTHVVSGS